MKKFIIQLARKIFIPGLLLSVVGISSANAATLADVVVAINNLRLYIASAVNTTLDTANKLIYEKNPNLPSTIIGNVGQASGNVTSDILLQNVSAQSSKSTLLTRDERKILPLASMEASDTYLQAQTGYRFGAQTESRTERGDRSMNFDSLLTPTVYNMVPVNFNDPNSLQQLLQTPPYNFIQLAGGLYQPITTVSLTKNNLSSNQIMDIQKSDSYQRFQAAVRAYVAAQSVGASNLYQLLSERIPQKGLGTSAGMTDRAGNPVADASLLQVQQYMATRRSENPEWYRQMETASPTTVSRETLFVLAEIREQLFNLQQQNERLLATLSVMQLQDLQNTKTDNLKPLEQAVNAQIKKAQR